MKRFERISHIFEQAGIWKGASWGIATMMLIDGVSFLIFGNDIASGPSFLLLRRAPYGMHSIGLGMTLVSLLIFQATCKRNHWAQVVLFVSFAVGIVLTCYTIGGWLNADSVAISTFSKWFLLSWLSLWLSAITERPPGGPPHAHR